jgi:hypothetical protein
VLGGSQMTYILGLIIVACMLGVGAQALIKSKR